MNVHGDLQSAGVAGFAICLVSMAASVFTVSALLPDEMIEPKWYAACGAALVGGIVLAALRLARPRCMGFPALWRGFGAACVVVCTAQAALFLLQETGLVRAYGRFTAGSFDNVAGLASCLGIGLPVGLRWLRHGNWWLRVGVAVCKALGVAAIVVSGSRSGLLCVAVCVVMVLPVGRRLKAASSMAVLALGLALALCVKAGSSRGRWFIALRTVELIGERPLLGHGPGGFSARYMDVQADWLARHEGCPEAMLADDVRHPLNEWLLVAVDYGVAGICMVLAFVSLVVCYARSHPTAEGRDGLRVMGCLGIFTMFSYPLLYPFTWLMLAASLVSVFRCALSRRATSLSAGMLVALPLCLCWLFREASLAIELRNVQDKAMLGQSERMMPRYARLYPKLRGDSRFLYNYAVEQYEAGRCSEALITARECGRLLASYDLCLIKGDIHRALGDLPAAMRSYRRAHWMVPSRFAPLYEMYNVASASGDTAAASALAREIMAKPVKVPSRETLDMIEDVRRRDTL